MSIRDDLKAYLDGELTEERAAEVRAALESDSELRKEADEIKALGDTLKTANIDYVAVGLEDTLVALQRASKPQPFLRIARYRWMFAGAAGLLIIGTLVFPLLVNKGTSSDVAMVSAPQAAAPLSQGGTSAAAKAQAPMATAQKQAERQGQEADTRDEARDRHVPSRSQPFVDAEIKGGRASDVDTSDANSPSVGYAPIDAAKAPVNQLKSPSSPAVQASGNLGISPGPFGSASGGAASADLAKSEAAPARAMAQRGAATMLKAAKDVAPPRLIINNGDVGVYVKDVKDAKSRAESAARAAGGYVQASDLQGDKVVNQVATLTLRVPVAKYTSVLEQVKSLGVVNRDSSTGTDVTSQVIDTEARLKTMKAEETQYRDIMKQAHKISDVLEVKDKLTDVREQIESLDAQAKGLRNQATLSTISVSFSVKPKEVVPEVGVVQTNSWLNGTVGSAISSFVDIAKALATILIFLLVFLPLWGPIVALSFWGYRVSRPQYRY